MDPLHDLGKAQGRGTTVTFWTDPTLFGSASFDRETVATRLKEIVYLVAGLRLSLRDEREDPPFEAVYRFPGGVEAFALELYRDEDRVAGPFTVRDTHAGMEVQASLAWTQSYTETLLSYVNSVPTSDGGTHEAGFKAALTKAVDDYARQAKLVKDKAPNVEGEDVREGLRAVLTVRMEEPMFEGQTKGRLGSPAARGAVEAVVGPALGSWLVRNPKPAQALVAKAVKAMAARAAARKARESGLFLDVVIGAGRCPTQVPVRGRGQARIFPHESRYSWHWNRQRGEWNCEPSLAAFQRASHTRVNLTRANTRGV